MNTENLACDDGRDGEGIEDIDERLPSLDVCAAFTFVVESINCCQLLP
jgi:hypothetical protein